MILPQIRSTQQTIIVEQIRARSPKCFFLSVGSTLSCTKEVDAYLTVIPQQQAGVVWTRNTLLLQHAAASCILCTPAVNLENLTNKIFQDPFLAKTFRRFSSPNLLTTQSVASTTTDRPKPSSKPKTQGHIHTRPRHPQQAFRFQPPSGMKPGS